MRPTFSVADRIAADGMARDWRQCCVALSRAEALGRSKMSTSGPVGVGFFEEGKFEGDSLTEEVTAQIRLGRANPV